MKWGHFRRQNVKVLIFTDGGARGNPGPAAVGFIVIDKEKNLVIKKFSKLIGVATNNVAEYLAVVEALKYLKSFPAKEIENVDLYSDSQLVVKQLNGFYKIKNAKLRSLIIEVRRLEQEVGGNVFYHQISREKNQEADDLVNLSLA